jgi:hypothetical protein
MATQVNTIVEMAVEDLILTVMALAKYADTPEKVERVHSLMFCTPVGEKMLRELEASLGLAIVPIEWKKFIGLDQPG